MATVLVAYASRHGGSRGIAEHIGKVLAGEGLDPVVTPAELAHGVADADAVIAGSGVYMGSWLKEGLEFIERYQDVLAGRPVWLFSSGPLRGSSLGIDPIENALGPAEGPGSGGRKRVEALAQAIHARGHRVFDGAFDPNDPPRAFSERIVRMMPAAKDLLPPGDFRDWGAIEAWARELAAEIRAPVAVA